MSILVDQNTRLLVQGFTGPKVRFHAQQAIAYGTNVVGGVTPGKGGQRTCNIVRYSTPCRRREAHRSQCVASSSCRRLSPPTPSWKPPTPDSPSWSASPKASPPSTWCAGWRFLEAHPDTRLIGPNCPGIISPGKCKIGIMPGHIHLQGHVGVVSRSRNADL